MVEVPKEEGVEAAEDVTDETFPDIIITVGAATEPRFLSEPIDELESASVHSDANSGSEPEPQPEEEEEEEQENEDEEGGQTEELAEQGLLDLSVFPSTSTLPQLLLLSLLQGEPEDQGEGSYCESKPGWSRPIEIMNTNLLKHELGQQIQCLVTNVHISHVSIKKHMKHYELVIEKDIAIKFE